MTQHVQLTLPSTFATAAFGKAVGECAHSGDVAVLTGELGCGKTCLAGGVAAGLGLDIAVTSPTFTLLQVYEGGRLVLYHFDLYRLTEAAQLEDIDFYAFAEGDGLTLVEWGDKFPEALSEADLELRLRGEDAGVTGGGRKLELLPCSERGQEWAADAFALHLHRQASYADD